MIKFRCLKCGQKISIAGTAADQEVQCPNCTERLVVPLQSTPEFTESRAVALQLVRPDDSATPTLTTRTVLAQHMARFLGSRAVQMLWFQRQTLLRTQQLETQRMAELEARIAQVQTQFQNRVNVYEARIATLERDLERLAEENQELTQANLQLVRRLRSLDEMPRVSLRDAGFLLRT